MIRRAGVSSVRVCGRVFLIAIGLAAVPRPLQAQQPQPAVSVAELRQRLDEIERAMQEQVAALRQQIAALEGKPPASGGGTPSGVSADQDTFSRDRESVARLNNQPLDPALQGFLAIPGTPARLKVDGYAKLDVIVDGTPAGNPDLFYPATIPIGLTESERVTGTTLHVRQTRLNLDFRSPTDFGGDFRTFAEIDFFGTTGAIDPRMRHFYGQVMNVLIGHTWTTFTDVDAFPDTLDLAGPAGLSLLRQPQVRYTQPLPRKQSLAFALERPLTQAAQVTTSGAAYSPAPDVIARYRLEGTRSHLQAGALFRALGYHTDLRNATTLGVGFNVSGAWKPIGQDVLMAYAAYGAGIARYIDNLAGQNADLDRNDAGTSVAAPPTLGTYVAYTHQWPRRFRSTGVIGFSGIDNTAGQAESVFRRSYYAAGNLLWNPGGSLNVGVEFLFGTHQLKSGADAQTNRLQFAAKYDFFRKRPLQP